MRFEGPGARLAGWLCLAVCLGLLGAALDQFHVQSELLSYPDPRLADQAAWAPLNFAVLLPGLVAATIPLVRRFPGPKPGNRRLASDLAWFVGMYGLSGVVAPDEPELLAVAYVV